MRRNASSHAVPRRAAQVIMYHDVVAGDDVDHSGFPGRGAARYKIERPQFSAHLDRMAAEGIQIGLLELDGRGVGAALTFDDGGRSAMNAAMEMERRGWRGHFFITTSRIGTPGFLTEEQLVTLAARGHVIGSHSHTHPPRMASLGPAQQFEEWSSSRARGSTGTGTSLCSGATPYCHRRRQVVRRGSPRGLGGVVQPSGRPGG